MSTNDACFLIPISISASLFSFLLHLRLDQLNAQLSLPDSLSLSLSTVRLPVGHHHHYHHLQTKTQTQTPTHESIPRAFLAPKNMTSAFSRLALITVDP